MDQVPGSIRDRICDVEQVPGSLQVPGTWQGQGQRRFKSLKFAGVERGRAFQGRICDVEQVPGSLRGRICDVEQVPGSLWGRICDVEQLPGTVAGARNAAEAGAVALQRPGTWQ